MLNRMDRLGWLNVLNGLNSLDRLNGLDWLHGLDRLNMLNGLDGLDVLDGSWRWDKILRRWRVSIKVDDSSARGFVLAGSMASQWSPSSSTPSPAARDRGSVSGRCSSGHHGPVHDLLRVYRQRVRERDGCIFVVLGLFSSGVLTTLLML